MRACGIFPTIVIAVVSVVPLLFAASSSAHLLLEAEQLVQSDGVAVDVPGGPLDRRLGLGRPLGPHRRGGLLDGQGARLHQRGDGGEPGVPRIHLRAVHGF